MDLRTAQDLSRHFRDEVLSAIVSMRNRLIHGYFDIDTEIVWQTASMELPGLQRLVGKP